MTTALSKAEALKAKGLRFSSAALRAFHTYASWLVSISWRRFFVLSVLLIVVASLIEDLPFLRWHTTEWVTEDEPVSAPAPPLPPQPAKGIAAETPGSPDTEGVDISIDEHGVRIRSRAKAAAEGASGASAASGAEAAQPAAPADSAAEAASAAGLDRLPEVNIRLPPGADTEDVKSAIQDAKQEIADAIRAANEAAQETTREAAQAAREQAKAAREQARAAREQAREEARAAAEEGRIPGRAYPRVRTIHLADFLVNLAILWVIGSAIIKITYKGRLKAEAQAAVATEAAEAEALKRQVIEARMAAMQAQVEPHFLFNTLASIDHLIETDPPRASKMQRNLIALLRASMPTMREASAGGLRDLGQELGVIEPYLEILKVRMEERLRTTIDVPAGLRSAEFPPMMIQSLVENAIKHGLEPKPDGGHLLVRAEILHGKLAVTVADTGLGFGKAGTAGTGVGLANIRERLQLLYGNKGVVTVAENHPSGTIITITVPYAARNAETRA